MKIKIGLLALATLFFSDTLIAQTAKEIAYKVYNRKTPDSGESDMTMTLINKKGKERVRRLHQFFIDEGDTEKKIMFFKSPADVKNTSFMNWTYDDPNENDDQWLFLPALKKVKRISNSSKDNQFMGSDFTYEDMERRSPEKDKHRIIREEIINGEDCWVMEVTPIEEEQYSKKIGWISKEKEIPVKIEFYDEDGELLKILDIQKIENFSGYWIVTKQLMKNIQKNHNTTIELSNLKINIGLQSSKFTQRAMQKGL